MPKNKGKGGKKFKRMKKGSNEPEGGRKLILRDEKEHQEYGKVIKLLGDSRVMILCNDDIERMGHIPGLFRRKKWIKVDDLILYNKRDTKDEKVDIIYLYDDNEKRKIGKLKVLSSKITENDGNDDDDIIEIEESESESESDGEETQIIKKKSKNIKNYDNDSDIKNLTLDDLDNL